MKKLIQYYDPLKNALVYCQKNATPDYWDKHWETENFASSIKILNQSIIRWTNKYLNKGSKILEGGCGQGQIVYSLYHSGFDAYGIDYAPKTIALINKYVPELKVKEADVRNLPFKDGFFDGYWSLGVIEHFYEGYTPIIKEMARVLNKNGYLFLSFPYMNLLRKIKTNMKIYSTIPQEFEPKQYNFYQFALDIDEVLKVLNEYGFRLFRKASLSGLKGLKDEVAITRPILQPLYDSTNIASKIIKKLLSPCLDIWCGHSILLILQKTH